MEFMKPGPNKRVCAFLIDSFLGQMLGIALTLVLHKEIAGWVWLGYILLKDSFNGQSLGKQAVGIKICNDEGETANTNSAILRNIFMVIPFFPLVEYFIMLKHEEGKRIGDRVAKTKVIDLKPEVADNTYFWMSLGLVLLVAVIQIGLTYFIATYYPHLLKKPA